MVYILLAIIVIFFGLTLAHMMQMTKLSHEVASLKAKQERLMAQNEGQASSQERTDVMALTYTGCVFSIDKYRQWAKVTYGGNAIPDWPRVCNGQPVYKENNKDTWVRGLDGEYRPCVPEWEVPAVYAILSLRQRA